MDFLVRTATGAPRLYQVCLDLADPKTRRHELSALAKAGEELGVTEGTVLTWDEAGEEMPGGIPGASGPGLEVAVELLIIPQEGNSTSHGAGFGFQVSGCGLLF